jgi:arsenate reductase-like glutaredoxin family protein
VLDGKQSRIVEERSARKEPLTDAEVRKLLGRVRSVTVARGKKVQTLDAGRVKPADLKGPTGNYRAPMVLRGKRLIVGYNADALEELL